MGIRTILTDSEVRAAYRKYQEGMSIREVAVSHYVSPATMETGFKRLGLPVRRCGNKRKEVTP